MMEERLKNLLETILPTYQYQMPAGQKAAITYQPYSASDEEYESGKAIAESVNFRVNVFLKQNSPETVQRVVNALRADGWVILYREWLIDTENKYYQHVMDIEKWEGIQYET